MSQTYATPRERTPSVYGRIYEIFCIFEVEDGRGIPSGLVHGTMWPLISQWRDEEKIERRNIERLWTAATGLPVPQLAPDLNSPSVGGEHPEPAGTRYEEEPPEGSGY